MTPAPETADFATRRRREVVAFLTLTGLIMPALAIGLVGAYGLIVWIYQMIAGPPGPPLA